MNKTTFFATILAITVAGPACSKNKKAEPAKPAVTDTTTTDEVDDKTSVDDDDDNSGSASDAASRGEVIYFEFDQSDLNAESKSVLDSNAGWLKEDAKRTLLVEGHTDEVGTTEYNLGLGDRRARAARDYLVALGIGENRITIITYGEERPASAADAENRRSVFVATKK